VGRGQQPLIDFFNEVDRVLKEARQMKAIVIGIMPQDKIRERVLSIARGEHKPKSGEPKIWFTSMRSLAEVLSIVKIAQYELPPHF
jgi:predicted transcriptional regulator